MFNQNVAIEVDGSATNYGLVSIVNGKSIRSNAVAQMGTPDLLTISHETKGSGVNAVDRHLVRIDTTFEAEEGGVATSATATAYVVLVAPHKVVTQANVKMAYEKVAAFLAGTESGAVSDNLTRLLNNEP